jgi:putative transposase
MSWATTTVGHGGDVVRDVMLVAVKNCFNDSLMVPGEIEWLTDNGSGYIAERTRTFATELGLKPPTTPLCSPKSNSMAESFVRR